MIREQLEKNRRIIRAFLRNRAAIVGLVIVLLLILIALLAPFISPHEPVRQSAVNRLQGPGTPGFFFGTDRYGRDILSRVIWGSRVSLEVGIMAVLLGMIFGIPPGLIAGYKGGWYDQILMRCIDVALSFPALILGMIILSLMGPGKWKVILAISFVLAPRFARMARGPTLSLKEKEFVQAAKALGVSDLRIIMTHILPNIMGDTMVVATLWIATAIRVETSLSFLGLGVQPPIPTWGNMVREGIAFISRAPWIALFPAIAIFLAILAFNMIGDGLRDVMDPRAQSE